MKKLIIIAFVLLPGILLAQQMPVSENYFMDKYTLSSSYAGHFNPGNLYTSFRSDWSGIDGGPKTLRLSYSDSLMKNVGYGFKMIYDKAGIFNQLYLLGTYCYNLKIVNGHRVFLALSVGLYRNTINFSDYYNDPKYNLDPVMVQDDVSSKLKFMSDVSALYTFKGLEAGIMFANINFGDLKYQEVDVTYKLMANYQIHAAYSYKLSDRWNIDPLVYYRGGKYIKGQFGTATRAMYQDNLWGSLSFRDPGIWGIGVGGNITKSIRLSYNFNFASSVSLNAYNSHEIALGLNIRQMIRREDK